MHTVKRVCTLVLTGLLALPMAAPAGAAAASFSDLPSSHWAYIAMTEAAGYGILQGTGANTMSPSAPLTWPQFLAMAARAFAPEEYARSATSGAAWDQAGLDAARSAGLLEGLDEAALTGAVTRQDAALLLCNALPEEYTPSFWDQPIDPTALSDWGRMDSLRQEAVAELARRCVIQGKADGSFGYADPLQRCDGAVLLMRVLEQVDNSCRGESQTVTLHILNADTGEAPHKNLFRVGFVSALAMALHNFPEGVATFLAGYEDLTLGVSITLAIALHNIPEGISVAMPVWYATGSRRRAFRCTLLSGLTEPVGAVLAFALLRPFLNGLLLGVLFGAVAGIMVYIAVEELIPSSRQYGHDRPALWATLCGICVMPLTHLFQT